MLLKMVLYCGEVKDFGTGEGDGNGLSGGIYSLCVQIPVRRDVEEDWRVYTERFW